MLAFGTPTLKSLARDDAKGLYVLFAYGAKETRKEVPARYRGPATWTSTDRGMTWEQSALTGVAPPSTHRTALFSPAPAP